MGRWKSLLAETSPGDFVVIEMGHNDESDPTKNDKYSQRGTLPGLGEESKNVNVNGKIETAHTFGYYLHSMIEDVKEKGAIPVISGMVPRNYWTGQKLQSSWSFSTYGREQAQESSVEFLDHTHYSVKALQELGSEKAGKLFPQDKTHTGPEGAKLNAETFVQAIRCGKESQLLKYLSETGRGVKAVC
jgi:rhamnogalacturonan acetylesterase